MQGDGYLYLELHRRGTVKPCAFDGIHAAIINNKNNKIMKNYAIYKKERWMFERFDGRKKLFRGITKEEFAAAKARCFKRWGGSSELKEKCAILETVEFLKKYVNTNYEKIIIEGNKHLYIASPIFLHSDYNKGIFAENTPKNRRKAELINKLLEKARKKA